MPQNGGHTQATDTDAFLLDGVTIFLNEIREEVGEEDVIVGEVDLLRRNNVSLLQALHEERRLRALAQDDFDAMRLEKEAAAEGHRVGMLRLQQQVRCLCAEAGLEDLFNLCEAEVRRLQMELHALRDRNMRLELQDFRAARVHAGEGLKKQSSSGSDKHQHGDVFLRQKAAEVDNLQRENELLRSMERGRCFSQHQSRDVARRLFLAAQTNKRLKLGLEAEERDHGATKGILATMRGEANALEDECRLLRKDNDRLSAEAVQLRAHIAEYQAKLRISSRVSSFVGKHKGR